MKTYFFVILISLFASNCAVRYQSIRPSNGLMIVNNTQEDVFFSYKYGVLNNSGNKKYVKKELLSRIQVVAVRITNNTGVDLLLNNNYEIMALDTKIMPLSADYVAKEVKQPFLIYLLYAPVFVPAGTAISVFNIARAVSANNKLKRDLEMNSLIGKSIPPGTTVYGIFGIENTGYAPLKLKLME